MRLRDNVELVAEIASIMRELEDSTDPYEADADRILDAVDRALPTPSPETGGAAAPTDEMKAKRLASTDGSYIEEFLADPRNRRVYNEEAAKEAAEDAFGHLGPLCEHGKYRSRCVECGAEPMNAQVGPAPEPVKPPAVLDPQERCMDLHPRGGGYGYCVLLPGHAGQHRNYGHDWWDARTPAAGTAPTPRHDPRASVYCACSSPGCDVCHP